MLLVVGAQETVTEKREMLHICVPVFSRYLLSPAAHLRLLPHGLSLVFFNSKIAETLINGTEELRHCMVGPVCMADSPESFQT